MTRAAQVADLIELRLDCLAREEFAALRDKPRLRALLMHAARPVILTLRAAEQGGRERYTADERARFWREIFRDEELTARFAFADIELDLLETHLHGDAALNRSKIICSHHDWTGDDATLASVTRIYERARATRAHVIKIAVTATDATACLPLFQLLQRARGEGQELIAIAMGCAGLPTRVLAPAHGGFLTFAALDDKGATAPGQPTDADLRDLYRVHHINARTMLTGLVGAPVAHSLSPVIHNRAFAASRVDGVYLPLEVHDFAAFIKRIVRPATREIDFNWRGFSVTAPHKETALKHLDAIDAAARDTGAVNTIVIEGGALHGYNTDAAAVIAPLAGRIDLKAARVAVIGAGGAARAALWSLREQGARTTVFARNMERARPVCTQFDAALAPLDGARFDGFDLVINATPLGTWTADGAHERQTPARAEQLRGARLAYDLVYNPARTAFMREAEAAGCEATGGLAMLIGQAAMQYRLWTGDDAPVEVMRRAAEGN